MDDPGRLIEGARPLARFVYGSEDKWRTMHAHGVKAELGLFVLGYRLCGFENVIRRRLAAKVEAASTAPKRRREPAPASVSQPAPSVSLGIDPLAAIEHTPDVSVTPPLE